MATTGEVLDANNLKRMGALKEIKVELVPEDPKEVIKRVMTIDGYPVWSKTDNPEVLAFYILSLEEEGYDTSTRTYDDFPDCPPDLLAQQKKEV